MGWWGSKQVDVEEPINTMLNSGKLSKEALKDMVDKGNRDMNVEEGRTSETEYERDVLTLDLRLKLSFYQ